MKLSIGFRTEPAVGQSRSGDTVVVRQTEERTLVAVIDVLGHGPRAAEVADRAEAHLHEVELSHDVGGLMMSLHRALHGSRGAAATLCVLQGSKVFGCGVGNVELRVQGSPVPISLTPGIIGQNVRQVREFDAELRAGDRLIWFSDGISSRANLDLVRQLSPDDACRNLFAQHRKNHDDASVVVADVEVVRSTAPSARRARQPA